MRHVWNWLTTPSGVLSSGFLLLIGLVVGALGLAGMNAATGRIETTEFCISCHEMRDTVYAEYKEKLHYSNASGVQAGCPDCHVPKPFIPKLVEKYQALGELYHSFKGTIDTPEKFEAHRLEMAETVWTYMKETDSRECRNCHSEHAMNFDLQKPEAAKRMKEGFAAGDTCIDCHKGIAHKLPDMSQGYKKMFEDLLADAATQGAKADDLYVVQSKPYFGNADDAKAGKGDIGQILAATHLKVLERSGDHLHVRIDGWQQDGVDRVIYELPGQRIFSATVSKDSTGLIKPISTRTDESTGLVWHEVQMEGWVDKTALLDSIEPLWAYGAEMDHAACGTCHSAPAADHYLANQWIGTMKAMERFITLNKEQYRFLQKYLQMHASDTGGAAEAQ